MTAYTGVILTKGRSGELGGQYLARGKFDLTAALANGDTITWTGIKPQGTLTRSFEIYGPELDTSATPTGGMSVGDAATTVGGGDPDGYLTTKGMEAAGDQLYYKGDGALIGNDSDSTNVVVVVNDTVASGASVGSIYIDVIYEGV